MDRLGATIAELAHDDGLHWVGATTPQILASPADLGERIGRAADLLAWPLNPLGREDAALWLALFGAHSLVHGRAAPSMDLVTRTAAALNELGPDARFFGQGVWKITRRSRSWEAVKATSPWADRRYSMHFSGGPTEAGLGVGGGVLGFDRSRAFILWVEEDD